MGGKRPTIFFKILLTIIILLLNSPSRGSDQSGHGGFDVTAPGNRGFAPTGSASRVRIAGVR